MNADIKTCSQSLLAAGKCCHPGCLAPAVVATLTVDTIGDQIGYVEHTRCGDHINDSDIAIKTLHLTEWP